MDFFWLFGRGIIGVLEGEKMVDHDWLEEVEEAFQELRARNRRGGPETGGILRSDEDLWEMAKDCAAHKRLVKLAVERAQIEGRDIWSVLDEERAKRKSMVEQ